MSEFNNQEKIRKITLFLELANEPVAVGRGKTVHRPLHFCKKVAGVTWAMLHEAGVISSQMFDVLTGDKRLYGAA